MISRRPALVARVAAAGSVILLYGAWSAEFIKRTSFITFDGQRRYCLFDDAMISMRYAWNLSHGDGLVWNPGDKVEGITNLLMTLYMALMTTLFGKFDSVLAVQISGAVFVAVCGFFSMKLGEQLLLRGGLRPSKALSVIFLAAPMLYFPLSYWALMGMETGLLAALLMASTWLAVRWSDDPGFKLPLAVTLSLAYLTRPDAAVFIAIIFAYRLIGLRHLAGWRRTILAEVGVLLVTVGATMAFRLGYYGSLVPNTYTLKLTGMDLSARLEDGLIFVKPFAVNMAPLFVVGVLGALIGRSRHIALLLTLVLAAVAYQAYVGGDAWNLWRLMAWSVPLLFVVTAVSVASIFEFRGWADRLLGFSSGWRIPLAGLLTLLAAVVVFGAGVFHVNGRFEKVIAFERPPLYLKYSKINTDQGLALEELLLPGATVGGTWAGTIPYYSGARGVDFLGKNDPHIATLEPDLSGKLSQYGMSTLPGHNKYDLDYSIKELRPTFIQVYRWGSQDLAIWAFKHYRRVPYKGVPLMLLRDSPLVRWELVPERYRPKESPRPGSS